MVGGVGRMCGDAGTLGECGVKTRMTPDHSLPGAWLLVILSRN